MRQEERIFDAVGAADSFLLERSERPRRTARPWLGWALAAAACLAVALAVTFQSPPVRTGGDLGGAGTDVPGSDMAGDAGTQDPDASLPAVDWGTGQRLHLLSFRSPLGEEGPRFSLYLDGENYRGYEQDGVYTVVPRAEMPEDLPACKLEIVHLPGVKAAEALARAKSRLEARRYELAEQADGFSAWDGVGWDSTWRADRTVDDGEGGSFLLTAQCFLEAAEGHGARFQGMMDTFRVLSAGAPDWMTALDDAASRLTDAVFSGSMEDAAGLLLPDAQVDAYTGEDAVVLGMDIAVDDGTAPTAAAVTVPYRRSPEDPGGTLTMELAYVEASGRWLAWSVRLEE